MFETPGWVEVDQLVGPVPAAPCPGWDLSTLLGWAARAPLTPEWLAALQRVDASSCTPTQRVRVIQAWDGIRQGAEAGFMAAVGALPERARPADDPAEHACAAGNCSHDWSREELAAALHLGPGAASSLLADARQLTGPASPLLDAVRAGRLPAYAARRIARQLARAPHADIAAASLARIEPKIGTLTPGALERLAQVTIDALRAPGEITAAHRAAHRAHTGIRPGDALDDGMGTATITASTTEIAELLEWARQFTLANRPAGDTRTVGQRRVDALLSALTTGAARPVAPSAQGSGLPGDLTDGGLTGAAGPDCAPSLDGAASLNSAAGPNGVASLDCAAAGSDSESGAAANGRRPAISLRLVMNADTLLGRSDDPAWLQGVGAIPAYLARALAVQPETLQRALVDATQQLLELGREQRVPLTTLRRFVQARDLTCTWPGCTRPSTSCDIDHIRRWADGGRTDVANLHPLCRRHHRARDAGWRPTRNADGTTTWTSPTGIRYTTMPPMTWGDHDELAMPWPDRRPEVWPARGDPEPPPF